MQPAARESSNVAYLSETRGRWRLKRTRRQHHRVKRHKRKRAKAASGGKYRKMKAALCEARREIAHLHACAAIGRNLCMRRARSVAWPSSAQAAMAAAASAAVAT